MLCRPHFLYIFQTLSALVVCYFLLLLESLLLADDLEDEDFPDWLLLLDAEDLCPEDLEVLTEELLLDVVPFDTEVLPDRELLVAVLLLEVVLLPEGAVLATWELLLCWLLTVVLLLPVEGWL